MNVPGFDGTNPLARIFKIFKFFNFHNIAEEQRIQIASFYLDSPALSWYQWMFYNNQLTSWTNFVHALQIQFGPSHFDDPQGALFKLTQKITVREYQTQSESLTTKVIGIPSLFFLSFFISGLKNPYSLGSPGFTTHDINASY